MHQFQVAKCASVAQQWSKGTRYRKDNIRGVRPTTGVLFPCRKTLISQRKPLQLGLLGEASVQPRPFPARHAVVHENGCTLAAPQYEYGPWDPVNSTCWKCGIQSSKWKSLCLSNWMVPKRVQDALETILDNDAWANDKAESLEEKLS